MITLKIDPREDKLPVWAKDLIRELRRTVRKLEEEKEKTNVIRMAPDSPGVFLWSPVTGNIHSNIRIHDKPEATLTDGEMSFEVRIKRDVTLDENVLDVNASGQIMIEPWATNHIKLRRVK